jgi:DNA mismatch endonuclease (patch repair protein)
MSRIRSRGNRDTELRMMALLRTHRLAGWRRGVRLLGKPDFVWRRERLALFVDGCFWHGCPRHGHIPRSNRAYWIHKLARNSLRDRETTHLLKASGWKVMRVWECALGPREALRAARRITKALGRRLSGQGCVRRRD